MNAIITKILALILNSKEAKTWRILTKILEFKIVIIYYTQNTYLLNAFEHLQKLIKRK